MMPAPSSPISITSNSTGNLKVAAGASPIKRQQEQSSEGLAAEGGASGSDRLTPLRELQLVEAYRRGGQHAREALGELLWGYQRRIYSICFRMVKNRDDASDVTQDVLLKIMEGLEGYDGRSKLSTWVIRVTINCCLSFLRREKVRSHTSLDSPAPGGTGGASFSGPRISGGMGRGACGGMGLKGREPLPGVGVEQDQVRAALVGALDSLDEESRALLVLRDLQDLDYQQLAEVFDLPLGTVKSRLFRARECLRTALEGKGL